MTPPADAAARTTTPRSGAPRSGAQPAPRRDQPSRPPLRVAPEPSRFRLPLRGIRAGRVGTIAGIALFVAMFALAAFQTVIIKSQADIDATTRAIAEQEALQRDLDYTLADLNSPQRVSEAAARLGLITPNSKVYLQPGPTDDLDASLTPSDSAASRGSTAP